MDELKNDIVSYEIGEDDMVMKKIDISRAEKSKIMKLLVFHYNLFERKMT